MTDTKSSFSLPPSSFDLSAHPHPLLFATISGAHLYGFPSADSDYDLRGAHILPLDEVIGLSISHETIDRTTMEGELEIDLVTHDIRKYFGLMLKSSGEIMEQVFSPLILQTTPEHEELKAVAADCLTKHYAHHYHGFATSQWKKLREEETPRVKPLLYTFRNLLTGIHLMQTGTVEPNLVTLNEKFDLSYIPELIDRKANGPEKATLDTADLDFYEKEFQRLREQLDTAAAATSLPERPRGRNALNDLLIRLRKKAD